VIERLNIQSEIDPDTFANVIRDIFYDLDYACDTAR